MSGTSDYAAENFLSWITGRAAMPALPAVFMALYSSPPTSNSGTGGTELSGSGYARKQVAGAITAGGAWTTGNNTITMGSTNPGWVVAGMNVWDATNQQQIGTVSSYTSTTLTLTTTAAAASSGATDSLVFSAFSPPSAGSGTLPAIAAPNSVNGAIISFAGASAGWTAANSWGLYDALTSGNLLGWDWLGNFDWLEFSCSLASPGVLTVPGHGYSNGDTVVVSSKPGGEALPATAGSWAGLLTVAGVTTDTFNLGVNTTGTGGGMVRKVVSQTVPSGGVFTVNASSMTLRML